MLLLRQNPENPVFTFKLSFLLETDKMIEQYLVYLIKYFTFLINFFFLKMIHSSVCQCFSVQLCYNDVKDLYEQVDSCVPFIF